MIYLGNQRPRGCGPAPGDVGAVGRSPGVVLELFNSHFEGLENLPASLGLQPWVLRFLRLSLGHARWAVPAATT